MPTPDELIPYNPNEPAKRAEITAPAHILAEALEAGAEVDPLAERELKKTIAARESEYQKKKYLRGGELKQEGSYREIMAERELEREELRVQRLIEQRAEIAEFDRQAGDKTPPRKRRRDTEPAEPALLEPAAPALLEPAEPAEAADPADPAEAAEPADPANRWEVALANQWEVTPPVAHGAPPPVVHGVALTSTVLDRIFPPGYVLVPVPAGYVFEPLAGLQEQPLAEAAGYAIPEALAAPALPALPTSIEGVKDLQFFKASDMTYFGRLLEPGASHTAEERREREIMRLLLEVKNGTAAARKAALRALTEGAARYTAKALFLQLLPLFLEPTLEEQERHLLVKLLGRLVLRLDAQVRPHVAQILVVAAPLLIDEDRFARREGREVVAALAQAAGLAAVLAAQRPDIDSADEYVRNVAARALAVAGAALGVERLVPFLRAVCRSRSWTARHTGAKVAQQLALLQKCGVLPHVRLLVACVAGGLEDEHVAVRGMAAAAVAALAEAAAPYGVEAFEPVLRPLWRGLRRHRGRTLAAFLRCVGCVVVLMEPDHAAHYTRELMPVVLREAASVDEEVRRAVLAVLAQCAASVTPAYLTTAVLPVFFGSFWVRRVALDSRAVWLVVDATVALAARASPEAIVERLAEALLDASGPMRKMAAVALVRVLEADGGAGLAGLAATVEERLLDAALTAFQDLADAAFLRAVGAVVAALGARAGPHAPAVLSTILFRLQHQAPETRAQAADLVVLVAAPLRACGEEAALARLGAVLFEALGEAYPEVLASVLAALGAVVGAVGLDAMVPPARQLVPALTPILRNRHDRVQQHAIELVGRLAARGAARVNAREWMRVCAELLEMLKSPRKAVRRAANRTFGLIATAIGPQDVLVTLLNNLKVQERQLRVCTAVAIGIVAETCAPFTVLPALMNEYRAPDNNVQNGVLKAMTFLFEYIGPVTRDYVYAVAPLVEDALTDRDQVHRQTAASVVRHMALGCVGAGLEDAFLHFLNLLLPNVLESSPQVLSRVVEGLEGVRVVVGAGIIMNYLLAGLFHPARKVRAAYWRVYNGMYVQCAQSMVPYYPSFDEFPLNPLDVWV